MKERSRVTVSQAHIETSIRAFRKAGEDDAECVVLWLGKRTATGLIVMEVYRPLQQAGADFFHIPDEGMTALMARLRELRGMVVAQVHSHPHAAFHSKADDEWAIVRHEGALSLVVPDFGIRTKTTNFWEKTKVFELSHGSEWTEIPFSEVKMLFEVAHE